MSPQRTPEELKKRMMRSMLVMAPFVVLIATGLGWLLVGVGDAIVTFVLAVLGMCFAVWLARGYDFRPYGSSREDPPSQP